MTEVVPTPEVKETTEQATVVTEQPVTESTVNTESAEISEDQDSESGE
jgi:hypothetical protein